jgi:hypothetical protein
LSTATSPARNGESRCRNPWSVAQAVAHKIPRRPVCLQTWATIAAARQLSGVGCRDVLLIILVDTSRSNLHCPIANLLHLCYDYWQMP